MSDYVEVTSRGIGGRGKDSIGGAIFGFILAAVVVFALFWNEGRSVKRYKDLKEGAGAVVSVQSETVDPAMEGKLIHITGETKTKAPLQDADFGIQSSAIKLIRKAEMFQWVEDVKTEEKTKVGGTTETVKTYSYSQEWKDGLVDSSKFKKAAGHQNPTEMKYDSSSSMADDVTVGAFSLPGFLVSKISVAGALAVETLEKASDEIRKTGKLNNGTVYFGSNPASPAVGDQRVSFQIVPNGPVSVVAQQHGNTFVSFHTSIGGQLDLLESGLMSAPEMFQLAQNRNNMLTLAIRVGGFVMLCIAFSMILRPIAVLASILPFLGRLVGTGTTIIAFLLAAIVWTLTVAVAWIFYRPILGIAILVVTAVLIAMVVKRFRKADGPALAGPPPLT